MIRGLISLYRPSYPAAVVYMLQSVEYQIAPYLSWYWRTEDFTAVMKRRELVKTKAAGLLLLAVRLGLLLQLVLGVYLIYQGARNGLAGGVAFGLAVVLLYPVLWAHLLIVPLLFGRWFVSGPAAERQIRQSAELFANHKGIKVAVAGSYGKTTMKELLATVLSQGLKAA